MLKWPLFRSCQAIAAEPRATAAFSSRAIVNKYNNPYQSGRSVSHEAGHPAAAAPRDALSEWNAPCPFLSRFNFTVLPCKLHAAHFLLMLCFNYDSANVPKCRCVACVAPAPSLVETFILVQLQGCQIVIQARYKI